MSHLRRRSRSLMPLLVCPHCHKAADVQAWTHDPPDQTIPFRRTCPNCHTSSDVSDLRQKAPWSKESA